MRLPFQVSTEALGLFVVFLFCILMLIYYLKFRKRDWRNPRALGFRDIPPLLSLHEFLGHTIEAGRRLHVTLGSGSLNGTPPASALVGLSMLKQLLPLTALSDKQTIATSGEGTLMILSEDTTRYSYRSVNATQFYDVSTTQLSGVTPFSYASGTLPVIYDQDTTINLLTGHFGSEAALITDAGDTMGSLVVAGSEDLSTQSILFTTTDEYLIGEEVFAGGAYTQAGVMHVVSLRVQDIIRWVVVLIILTGISLKLARLW